MIGPAGRGLASLLALCAGMSAACADSGTPQGIDEKTFVATYVDLRSAVVADSLDAAMRDSILAVHEVTAEDLRAYVERHETDPEALAQTWRAILDSIAVRDSAATDTLETVTP